MVRYFSNIRFCSFNIEGLKNKLEEKEFCDTISKFDFITLVETSLPGLFKVDIPNLYVYTEYQKTIEKARKYSGGISVAIRKDLKSRSPFFHLRMTSMYDVSLIKLFLILMKIFMFAPVIFPQEFLSPL